MEISKITQERAESIARNINAMDDEFEYIDERKDYKFWKKLKTNLENILASLSDSDKKIVTSLCDESKRKYFNLI